ncbi:MAG TPA: ribosome small subunit-dependent GTPase A [Eubacteriaceae bacterium]|nr:ribosome small subunit-dependent GTPase A [Eubacteriaceae bacterium]
METTGTIIKGVGGFYTVLTDEKPIVCKARGIFRKNNKKPYVGDLVSISIPENPDEEGMIEQILPRKNTLLRPPLSNISQIILVFSYYSPSLNEDLLNKMLLQCEHIAVRSVICINKSDLITDEEKQTIEEMFRGTDYPIRYTSVLEEDGLEELKDLLSGQVTVFSGPSGTGKSSLLKKILPTKSIEIGELSRKGNRGKHTTRHVELFRIEEKSFVADTPGYGNIENLDMMSDGLKDLFPEFEKYRQDCRFSGCNHINEPGCEVKNQVGTAISPQRYDFYKRYYEEIKRQERW